jgi:hypothetical protein
MDNEIVERELPEVEDIAIENLADTVAGNCLGTLGSAGCPACFGTLGSFT